MIEEYIKYSSSDYKKIHVKTGGIILTLNEPYQYGVQPFEFWINNTRYGYFNTSGFIYSSSELKKESIRIKKNNDVLNRLLKLKIHSFKFKEANDLMTGLIINEDLYNLFPNIINFKNYDTDSRKTWNELTEKEKYDLGYNINTLVIYFIMAFQEAYNSQREINIDLINKYNEHNDILLNKKINKTDSYKNLLSNNIDNSILDLQNKNDIINKKNEILNNRIQTLETKYNILNNDYINVCKSYDELYTEIKQLKEILQNKQDIPPKTSSLLKKSTTLKIGV